LTANNKRPENIKAQPKPSCPNSTTTLEMSPVSFSILDAIARKKALMREIVAGSISPSTEISRFFFLVTI